MHEQNKNRLALITQRFAQREAARGEADDGAFDEAFIAARDAVIRPVMEEVLRELLAAGHAPRISIDEMREQPSIALHLGIRGSAWPNLVAFCVIKRRKAREVLAFLDVNRPNMDLIRYAHPTEITPGKVEQLVVDAVEHIFACQPA